MLARIALSLPDFAATVLEAVQLRRFLEIAFREVGIQKTPVDADCRDVFDALDSAVRVPNSDVILFTLIASKIV